jgi:hypothetical protein
MTGDDVSLTRSTEPTRPRFQFRTWTLVLLVGLSACFCGLWTALTAMPPTQVSGVVTHNGQPLGSGTILFEPGGPQGRKASGLVANGRYSIKPGMLPGNYTVGIQDSRKAIPAKYNSPKTSGLSVRIMDARSNSLSFDIH